MFRRKGNNILYNNSKFEIQCTVECISNVIEKDKRKYINIKILDNLDVLILFDKYCYSNINIYKSFIVRQEDKSVDVFVKLPFRYNRYDIKFNHLMTSECFEINKQFKCILQFGGFINNESVCFKIVNVI